MDLRKKIYFSLIIFSILIIFLIVFVIEPLFKGIKNNSNDLIFQKQQFISLEAKIKDLKEFKVFSQSEKENLEKIAKLFIDPDLPVEFISFLESVSQECQIPIKISALPFNLPSKEKEKAIWQSLNFQISCSSAFPKFLRFLEKLENSPYLITIQNVNINDVKINLSIKVYAKAN